jgi:hypothetical protein
MRILYMHAWCQTPPPPRHVRMQAEQAGRQAGTTCSYAAGRTHRIRAGRGRVSPSRPRCCHAWATDASLLCSTAHGRFRGRTGHKKKKERAEIREILRCDAPPIPFQNEPNRAGAGRVANCHANARNMRVETGDLFWLFHPSTRPDVYATYIPPESDVYASVESPCNEMQEGRKAYAWVGPAATGDTPLSLPLPILLHQAITLQFHQQ